MCVAVFHAVCSIFSNVSRSSRVTPFIWTVSSQCLYCRATAMLVYVSLLLSGMTCSLMRPGRVWNWHHPQETRPPSAVPGTGMRLVSSRFTAVQKPQAAVVIHSAVFYLTLRRKECFTNTCIWEIVKCLLSLVCSVLHSVLLALMDPCSGMFECEPIWMQCAHENRYKRCSTWVFSALSVRSRFQRRPDLSESHEEHTWGWKSVQKRLIHMKWWWSRCSSVGSSRTIR